MEKIIYTEIDGIKYVELSEVRKLFEIIREDINEAFDDEIEWRFIEEKKEN